MRSLFTPIFTSGKMKAMLPLIELSGKRLAQSLARDLETGGSIDLKDKFGKYSMDVIASCAFGVDSKTFDVDESPLVENAKGVFRTELTDTLKFLVAFMMPFGRRAIELLGIPLMKEKPIMFFHGILQEVTKQRREGKVQRNDLIDLMLRAMSDDEE